MDESSSAAQGLVVNLARWGLVCPQRPDLLDPFVDLNALWWQGLVVNLTGWGLVCPQRPGAAVSRLRWICHFSPHRSVAHSERLDRCDLPRIRHSQPYPLPRLLGRYREVQQTADVILRITAEPPPPDIPDCVPELNPGASRPEKTLRIVAS
jgi:hypothetical protein